EISRGRNLSATGSRRRVSCASQTTPMPPSPRIRLSKYRRHTVCPTAKAEKSGPDSGDREFIFAASDERSLSHPLISQRQLQVCSHNSSRKHLSLTDRPRRFTRKILS